MTVMRSNSMKLWVPTASLLTRMALLILAVASTTFGDPGRQAATTLTFPPQAPTRVVDAFPGLTFGAPTSMDSPPGDTNRIFVAEKSGRIQVITNITALHPNAVLFLDITAHVTNDNSELGLKGLAFHPGYETNGIFFVTYCSTQGTVRLSRFLRQSGNPDAADPNSEVMLINQENEGSIHNIDDAVFGPDGYLYVGMGDEGHSAINNPNAQVITQDLWSAIIRIDPDKRPGNLEPPARPGVPTNAAGFAYYAIPTNNPFLGSTQFNGFAVDPATVRSELFAVGFRNPWQFSFDSLTGDLWVGDVGDSLWEEIDLVPAGGNGGWPYFEGTHPVAGATPPPGFTYLAPVWEYVHDNGSAFGGSAVAGGFVVRGDRYPDLEGQYLCVDVLSGNIWALLPQPGTTLVERIAGESTIVQFGSDPSNGDVLMVDFDEGKIRRLLPEEPGGSAALPSTLSASGVFSDLAALSPNPGVVPYDVNLSFWSDYAVKRRWFALTNLSDYFTYSDEGAWASPAGAVWIKHFDLDLERGNASTRKRIETRVLVRTTNGSYGLSYRWNESGTEAALVSDVGDNFNLAITNAGSPTLQAWRIPSRAECAFCHNTEAGHALSFSTRQLNRTGELAGVSGNFIERMAAVGYFNNAVGDPNLWPRHVRPDETQYSREVRARSYLAVNCGYCHRGATSVQGSWDARAHLRLVDCGVVRVPASQNGGDTNNLLLVPGAVSNSIIWNRMAASNGFTRMPPLASHELDPAGLQLVADWIAQDLPDWQSYLAWRQTVFGSTNTLEGEPEADPDEDGYNNNEEFLAYSNPTNENSYWKGDIELSGSGVEVSYDLVNRSVRVERSLDLAQWSFWSVVGNHGLPSASGQVIRLNDSGSDEHSFYRFRLEER